MLLYGSNLFSKSSLIFNTFNSCRARALLYILKASNNSFSSVFISTKPLTLDYIKEESKKREFLLYIHDKNDTVNESELKTKYSNSDLIITSIKNVQEDVISHFEISNLPFVTSSFKGDVEIPALTCQSLKSLVENPNSDLEAIAIELAKFIDNHVDMFSTNHSVVQVAASAAVSLSDLPCYTPDQLQQFLNDRRILSMNSELDYLVDSALYKDKIKEQLLSLQTGKKYSESGCLSRVHRALSAKYFRAGNHKLALDHAYKSLKIDLEEQQSSITVNNILRQDPRKIDIFGDSHATIFIKHLIMAIGESEDVLDFRAKIEFMFRDTRFVPLKFKSKSRPYGGPPKKGRGYRSKWIWHGFDHREGRYKPKDIYKYHDEWRTIHDKGILDY